MELTAILEDEFNAQGLKLERTKLGKERSRSYLQVYEFKRGFGRLSTFDLNTDSLPAL